MPWRFSDASCWCAWIASSSGRPRNANSNGREPLQQSTFTEVPLLRHKPALCELHVPEYRCSELENVPDVLAEGCWLGPLAPRHVGNFAQSDPLDLVGESPSFWLIGGARPIGDKLFELRDIRPAEPGARATAR